MPKEPREDVLVRVRFQPDGSPAGASARVRVARAPAEVWTAVADVERLARHLPMVRRATRRGDEITLELGFRVALFSVGFQFTASATSETGKWLELVWVAGEPRGIKLRLELTPADEGRACVVEGSGEFDVMSLGWLAKYFLKHHPEIQLGIFPGVALSLVLALERSLGG